MGIFFMPELIQIINGTHESSFKDIFFFFLVTITIADIETCFKYSV